jgi:hypothetical protein
LTLLRKMKRLILLPLLTSWAFAEPVDKILTDYYRAVATEIAKDPRSLGGMEGLLKKYEELGKEHLLKNKEALHKKAVADYLALPILEFAVLEKEERIAWIKASKFDDGKTVRPELAKTALDNVVLMFSESGYEIPPFNRTVFSTLWWSPVKAARTVRELSFRRHLEPKDVERRKFVEQHSPPLIFRIGDDGEKPCIVFFDGAELFALNLQYMEDGIYCVSALKWVKLKDREKGDSGAKQ